jgi:hypothetical protein
VHEEARLYFVIIKDINSHWVKGNENIAFVGKKHLIWSIKQKTRLGEA